MEAGVLGLLAAGALAGILLPRVMEDPEQRRAAASLGMIFCWLMVTLAAAMFTGQPGLTVTSTATAETRIPAVTTPDGTVAAHTVVREETSKYVLLKPAWDSSAWFGYLLYGMSGLTLLFALGLTATWIVSMRLRGGGRAW